MRVTYFQRLPVGSQISIERLFDGVRRNLSSAAEVMVYVCAHPSRGFLPRIKNLLAVRRFAGHGIYHVTGDVHYLALALPGKRTVLTIHDCAVLHRLRGWRRFVVLKLWFEWPIRFSAVTTVISFATRDDLFTWISAKLHGRIRVIPNCVGDEFVSDPKLFNKKRPVFLQVGTGWNKNLERVVEALRGVECCLEIVGSLSERQLILLESAGIDFRALGRVSDGELIEAYRRCDVLIFVSLFEGFGLPVIEAQATGRPVITSKLGALIEVAGEGAFFVDPESNESIRCAIFEVIENEEERKLRVEAGYLNVQRFKGRNVAAQYEEIYKDTMSNV